MQRTSSRVRRAEEKIIISLHLCEQNEREKRAEGEANQMDLLTVVFSRQ